jgi:quercetin dioxygenase-like cupin family protein
MSKTPEYGLDTMRWAHALCALPEIPGYEVGMRIVRRGPGVQGKAHYHPGGHEWFTIAKGSLMFTKGDAPAKLFTAGEGDHIPPDVVHHGRNPSDSETVEIVLFYLKPVGAPVLVEV